MNRGGGEGGGRGVILTTAVNVNLVTVTVKNLKIGTIWAKSILVRSIWYKTSGRQGAPSGILIVKT